MCVGACVCAWIGMCLGVGDVVDDYVNSVVCVWEEREAIMSQGFKV